MLGTSLVGGAVLAAGAPPWSSWLIPHLKQIEEVAAGPAAAGPPAAHCPRWARGKDLARRLAPLTLKDKVTLLTGATAWSTAPAPAAGPSWISGRTSPAGCASPSPARPGRRSPCAMPNSSRPKANSNGPDGTLHPSGMNSLNHYALGAAADRLHRVVGGLAPDEPGYRTM